MGDLGSCMVGGKLKVGVERSFLAPPSGLDRIRFGAEMDADPETWEDGW